MSNGICTALRNNRDGSWQLEGFDAGARLMRALPPVETLSSTADAKDMIIALATHCGVDCTYSGAALGIAGRAIVAGSTCADAIVELALLCGCVASISNGGVLKVHPPSSGVQEFDTVLSEGESIDTDGYANKVMVLLHRRVKSRKSSGTSWWEGSTPSGTLTEEVLSGSLPGGSYSMTVYEPIGMPKEEHVTLAESGMTQRHDATYEYAVSAPLEIREGQEWRVIKWALQHSLSVTQTEKTMDAFDPATGTLVPVSFSETTTHEVARTVNLDSGRVTGEVITSKTVRTGEEDANPATFDRRISRYVEISAFGRMGLLVETEEGWVRKELGVYRNVQGANATYEVGGKAYPVGIKSHSTIGWVLETTTKVTREVYDEAGDCLVRMETTHADEGVPDVLRAGVATPADSAAAAMARIKNFQTSDVRMTLRPGGTAIPFDVSVMELPGRRQVFEPPSEDGSDIQAEKWYVGDGLVVPFRVCPHYVRYGKRCRISGITGSMTGDECPRDGRSWKTCPRAEVALGRAERSEAPMARGPVVGTAGTGGIVFLREVSVDQELSDAEASALANTLAENILSVKMAGRGVLRTISVPLDLSIEPGGAIVGVSHDMKGLLSRVTYLDSTKPVPEYALTRSLAMRAMEVFDKEISQTVRYVLGSVIGKDDDSGDWHVAACDTVLQCASYRNHSVGDTVLVFLPPGATQHGVIVKRR